LQTGAWYANQVSLDSDSGLVAEVGLHFARSGAQEFYNARVERGTMLVCEGYRDGDWVQSPTSCRSEYQYIPETCTLLFNLDGCLSARPFGESAGLRLLSGRYDGARDKLHLDLQWRTRFFGADLVQTPTTNLDALALCPQPGAAVERGFFKFFRR
jgi:hypothetical protein